MRIERWTRDDGDVHWRSISRDGVTNVYGADDRSRVADPTDRSRVFRWLVCATYDEHGNAVEYTYRAENADRVPVEAAHERHRDGRSRGAARHLKTVRYGNRHSTLVHATLPADTWMFEVVLDYGEHDSHHPRPDDTGIWACRADPWSSYRAGFEERGYRLCQRILMFHHFRSAQGVGVNCLVRSLDLAYRQPAGEDLARPGEAAGSMLASVTLTGYERTGPVSYRPRSLPPLELEYSEAQPPGPVQTVPAADLGNLPIGIEGGYQLVDLHGEGIPGVLAEEAGGWYYTPPAGGARFGPVRELASVPALTPSDPATHLVDLAGDGTLDVAAFGSPTPGFYERREGGWEPYRAFTTLPQLDWDDPQLRLVDLTGDGRADVLVLEGDALVWYPSLGEAGFGPGQRLPVGPDDAAGPRLLFSGTGAAVFAADVSGDGLPDLVQVRNGEVCYWPSLGRGRFGRRVVMDNAPVFDHPDRFDPARVRPADVDGNGLTDLLYVGDGRVDLYRNLMGNAWAPRRSLSFPPVPDPGQVTVGDLLGTGTACLIWSSPAAADASRQVRYVDLVGTKPHLLTNVRNNLGTETDIRYGSAIAHYLADRAVGRPWVTRLPFPVHVVERVQTRDRIDRTQFVTTYRYRDGRFDGHEREFCGFGMVEQRDTEDIPALAGQDVDPDDAVNLDPAGRSPPMLTRSWFHTGGWQDRERPPGASARDFYPPPDAVPSPATTWRLPDSVLDGVTTPDGHREACRALMGRPLRQEVYGLDGGTAQAHPYVVTEQSYTVRQLQAATPGGHGVFAVDSRESLTVSCERDPQDARIAHQVVLEVDQFGTVLDLVSLAYGRTTPGADLPARTQAVQARSLMTRTLTCVTTGVDTAVDDVDRSGPAERDAYRVPVPYEVSMREITGSGVRAASALLTRADVLDLLARADAGTGGHAATLRSRQRVRFASDADPHVALPFGELSRTGLVQQAFVLALTSEILAEVFGARVSDADLLAAGYVQSADGWWAPSGTVRYTPVGVAAGGATLIHARTHFFLPRRFVDQLAAAAGLEYGTAVEYDQHDLLPLETVDALGNRTTAGERDATGARTGTALDYRVLGAALVTDPNRNRTAVAHDALGRPVATAVMGKPEDDTGDRLPAGPFDPEPAALAGFVADPRGTAAAILGTATTRLVHDTDAYLRSRAAAAPLPAAVYTLARERHVADPPPGEPVRVDVSVSYADGLGQVIQTRRPAEPEPQRAGGAPAPARWVVSGWVVPNNKGLPVRRYEPFFATDHAFEFAVKAGVSSAVCYDAVHRPVVTLHPDHTWEKVVHGAWEQAGWDANDTVAVADPKADPDVGP